MALEGLRRRLSRLLRRGRPRGGAPVAPPPRVYRPGLRLGIQDVIDVIAMTYFRGAADRLVKTFELDRAIKRAGMSISPQMYAARLLLYTTISAVIAVYFSVLIAFLPAAPILKVLTILVLLLSPLIIFGVGLSYPNSKVGERMNGVDAELPFFAAYLSTMTHGGVPVAKVLERVANLRVFKAIRREAGIIARDVRVFGKDPLTAIEDHAIEHPSYRYRDLMLGYVTTVRTGGDVLHYIEIRTQDLFNARISEMKSIAEKMRMFTEAYVTVAVILALVFYIFFTITAVFPAGPRFGGTAQLALFSFVFLPIMTVLLLYLIHQAQPRTPISFNAPYRYTLYLGVPLALTSFPVVLYATPGYQALRGALSGPSIIGLSAALAVSLVVLLLPGAIVYTRERRRSRGLGRATASFLRDLAEIRKTGLSPERSIQLAAERDYGPLTPVIRRVAAAISVGVELEEAMRRALRGFRDWLLLANMRFLVDSILVGGGTSETLDALARYAYNLVEIEEGLRRELKPYIFMPYAGAFLVVISSLLVLGFTASTLASTQPGAPGPAGAAMAAQMPKIALLLTTSGILNSWLMGLVAGKIQDSYLAGGFTHAIILTILSLATSIATLHWIHLTPAPP